MPPLRPLTYLLASFTSLALAGPADAARPHRNLPAAWAAQHHLGVRAGARDADRDGLTNWGEFRAKTRPNRRDSDRDGLVDALEDRDRDGLVNGDEISAGLDPRRRDSDRDRIPDGREDFDRDRLANADERRTGHDVDQRDSDGDGTLDGLDNAGTLTAVTAGSVTVRLAVGGTLTALLSGASWVDCSSTAPAAGGAETSQTSAPGGSTPPGEPTADGAVDPGSPPATGNDPLRDEVEPIEEDPAGLPAAVRTFAQTPDDDEADEGDGVDAGEAGTAPDLGSCASRLRVGAVVHKATVAPIAGGLELTGLELMAG